MAEGFTDSCAKAFGRRLRAQRNLIGLSEEYMAEQLNIELSSYKQMERGHHNPSVDKLMKIKSLLHVSIDYLIDGDNDDPDEERRIIIENIEGCFSVCSNYNLQCVNGMLQYYVRSLVGQGPYPEEEQGKK